MYSRIFRNRITVFPLGLILISMVGCSFGPNNPNVRNALDMLRVERDAAEDEYYALKQKHDEALWKIEDLESQLKSIQEEDRAMGASYQQIENDQLESIDSAESGFSASTRNDYATGSEYANPNTSAEFVEPSPSGSNATETPRLSTGGKSDVRYVDIDSRMTRGFDSHGKSGDDGIIVAIKPMDPADQFIAVAAPVTISLIDPARKGIRQRVGLWKFTAKQVANRIDYDNNVFLFRLPWQRNAPINSDLKLFVRYEANDGKRETEMDLPVSLDNAPASSWKQVAPGPDAKNISPSSTYTMSESDTGASEEPGKTDSPQQIARPEWSPYR